MWRRIALLNNLCVPMFRLYRIARSTVFTMSIDLLLVCSLTVTTCAIMNIVTALIFNIVCRSHAFSLVMQSCHDAKGGLAAPCGVHAGLCTDTTPCGTLVLILHFAWTPFDHQTCLPSSIFAQNDLIDHCCDAKLPWCKWWPCCTLWCSCWTLHGHHPPMVNTQLHAWAPLTGKESLKDPEARNP